MDLTYINHTQTWVQVRLADGEQGICVAADSFEKSTNSGPAVCIRNASS